MIIETIDGIRGEWRAVTKEDQVVVGQRVRYTCRGGERFGYEDSLYSQNRFMEEEGRTNGYSKLFENGKKRREFSIIQAFYPIGKKEKPVKVSDKPKAKRKIAKVNLYKKLGEWDWDIQNFKEAKVIAKDYFKSEEEAILSAKNFCKLIGHEMEIIR